MEHGGECLARRSLPLPMAAKSPIKQAPCLTGRYNLVQHTAGPLLTVWDWLPAHRSRLAAEFVELLKGQIALEYLPAYAPALNPVEYLWGHWKRH
jgi:transposase